MSGKVSILVLTTAFAVASLLLGKAFISAPRVFATPEGTSNGTQKVYVCKYVGTPGSTEHLQTGQNPIEVAVSTLPSGWSVGAYFTDQQGRSYVLATVPQTPEPTAANCPQVTPTGTPTTAPTTTPTTAPTSTPTNAPTSTPTTAPTSTPTTVPTSTPTDAPTSTPTTTPAPISRLLLTSICWESETSHKFRVRNSNSVNVDYDYQIYSGPWISGNIATVGDSFFTINGTYGQANTTKIRWLNENDQYVETVKATNQQICENEEPTPTPEPTVTPGDVCWNLEGIQTSVPDGYHKDTPDGACNTYEFGGPPSGGNGPQGQVLGTSTVAGKGQVLGASTMAKTGGFEETLYQAIMVIGGTLTGFGLKNFKKASKKA